MMRILLRLILCMFVAVASAILTAAASEPPTRVGRISLADTGTAFRPGGDKWADAIVNVPVATGTSLRTARNGRGEFHLPGIAVALAPATEIDIVRLDEHGVQLALRRGRIGVRLDRIDSGASVEIDTARGGLWLLQPGQYAIGAGDRETPTTAAAFAGRGRFVGGGVDRIVAAGTATLLTGDETVSFTSREPVADSFTEWWRARDTDKPVREAAQHVYPAMTGGGALDGNGAWETGAEFGTMWFPANLPGDWAPFRHGSWRSIAPWGWTWIDDAAWGFAPSHYGRWARIGERWGWLPGPVEAEPVYVPAVVAFLGTSGIGLSYAGGYGPATAWFPLGPEEIYWPSYTADPGVIRRANASAAIDPSSLRPGDDGEAPGAVFDAHYRYRRFASAVPRAVFAAGKPVASALVALPETRLDAAPVSPGSPRIAAASPHPAASQHLAAAARAKPARHRVAASLPPAVKHTASAAHPRARAAGHDRAKPRIAAAPKRPASPASVAETKPRPGQSRTHIATGRHLTPQ